MFLLSCFILQFAPYECSLDSLFTGNTTEVFGKIVPNQIPSQFRWLGRFQSELRLSFHERSISFRLRESSDQSRVRLESLFTARGFSKPKEPSFAEQSDFSLRSGYLIGNKSVRMTGFVLDGIFSGFVDGSADGVEVNVRAKYPTFLEKGQTYILTRKKLGLIDDAEISNFCGYQRFANTSNYSRNLSETGRSSEFLSGRTTKKIYCRSRYSIDPKATKLWLDQITSPGPLSFRIRQLVGMILSVVFAVNQKLLMLPMCKGILTVCHFIQLYVGYKDVSIFAPDFCLGKISNDERDVYCFDASVSHDHRKPSNYIWNHFVTAFPCDYYHCTCILVTANDFGVVLGLAQATAFYRRMPLFQPNLLVNIKRSQSDNFLSPLEAAIVNTHEIGHQLGSDHDDDRDCGMNYIMASKFTRLESLFALRWSECSVNNIHKAYTDSPRFDLSRFPSKIPCVTNVKTKQSCLSPHACCHPQTCVLLPGKACSPTGVLNAECCTEGCKWADGRKCWGTGDRQCTKPGLCAFDKCTASPLRNGTRCDRGICVNDKCSNEGICAFLKSAKCLPPVTASMVSNTTCFHHCYKRNQNCKRAVLSDGKPIPMPVGKRCVLSDGRFGFCSLSNQCILTDTRNVDWRQKMGRSIPVFFHPLFLDETGKSLVLLWPSILLLWIIQMIFASVSYIILVHSDHLDVMGEIYHELVNSKWKWS